MFEFIQEVLRDCPDLTSTHFPHLFENTKPDLSATLKESLQMCSKKSERNIMIFIVRLHYAVSICNAFRLENDPKYKAIKFDFHTFPILEDLFKELEFDRNMAMNQKGKRKRRSETIEIHTDESLGEPPQSTLMDGFIASFEHFKDDQYDILEEIAARLDRVEHSISLVYNTVRK